MVESRRRVEGIQRVLNQEFPLVRKDGTRHAEGIPDHPRRPVRARVVFEHDGEEYLDGLAQRWTKTHVFVVIPDPRTADRRRLGARGRRPTHAAILTRVRAAFPISHH